MRSFLTLLFLFGFYLSYAQENITAMEYYLDTDPGYGNATAVTIVTPATTIDVDFTISNALLSEGFHLLVIRTQDATGLWGVQESTVFYVSPGDPVTTATVDAAEYYLDTDPGYGNGTPITVSSGTTIDADFVVPNASISSGFHSLVIRLQDSDGQWGVQETKAFYVSSSDPTVISNIVAAEYYLDIDPGHGSGETISISAGLTIDADFIIPNADISEGFHSLVIRFQDSEGQWGMEEKTAFFVTNSDPIVTAEVVAAEYYLDADPGVGSATALTVVAGTLIDIDFTISSAALTEGFHSLVIRLQDAEGQWGVQEAKALYVSNTNPLGTTLITDLEYFIDVDPGVGSATPIAVTDIVNFDVDAVALTNGLAAGMHTLNIRAKDQMGVWGMLESKNFLADEFISSPLISGVGSKVASFEYFVGDDPGYGLGTQVVIDPALAAIDEDIIATTSGLAFGDYTLGIRVANEVGFFSQTDYVPFAICDGALIQVDVVTTCLGSATLFTDMSTGVIAGDAYSWDFDGDGVEDDNTVGDVSFTFVNAGDYTGSLTISNSECTATKAFSVSVVDLPTVVANATLATICLGDEVTLTGSGASTYTWDQSIEDGVAFAPAATLTYTVTGTDAGGCVATDMIEIPVVTLIKPTISVNNDNLKLVILQSSESAGNQWYFEGTLLEGATDQTLTIDERGDYSVEFTDGDCSILSDVLNVYVLGLGDEYFAEVSIWPNPVDQQLTIEGLKTDNFTITVVNLTGAIVVHQDINVDSDNRFAIDTSHLSSGIYLLSITGFDHQLKFIKR